MVMKDELFADLMASIEEAGRIARGEIAASRTFTVERDLLDVTAIRERFRLSQTRFAALLGISVKTLRNWEQGRNKPDPAALSLIRIFDQNPDLVLDAVYQPKAP